ncbi:hypothetical protein A4D02_13810 [Niastella koreensis]|uniref:TIR domain-containing protein n=2 Tax=Niastella koreensis TaxID=354356 RepID=G8TQ30_NIAKG|nr:TIR domain-containing protein [Niastella koreensis]AEW01031.1 hypothetical protein Niako_4780 [Niastella koreensis GR20-10]OQP42635.1 hypothetical protein A4D02_13810 [Niastella koreensis]
MKVFISWSGERSRQVAELLNVWIQCVLQAVDPWLSTKDIDKGSLWFSEITNQLSSTQNGIVCLTKANLSNPWILFESGALAKGLTSNRVYIFLVDLKPNDVKDPLAQFNHTMPSREGVFQLIRSINNGLGEKALRENIIANVYETYWPQFEKGFKEILSNTPEEEIKEERPKEDLLNEILYSVRAIDKRLRKVEDTEQKISDSVKPRYLNFKSDSNIEFGEMGDRPIEDLELSVHLFNFLKSQKINTVKDIRNVDTTKLDNVALKHELIRVLTRLINLNKEN